MIRSNDLRAIKGATAVKSQYKDNTDPAYIGSGYWIYLHSKSMRATTKNLQLEMIRDIRDICDNFPCHTCREHAQAYLKLHPPEEYLGVQVDGMNIGIFVWVWLFHNSVNARINKPIMSWDTAFDLYNITEDKKEMCGIACLSAGMNNVSVNNGNKGIIIPNVQQNKSIVIPNIQQNTVRNFTPLRNLY